MALAAIARANRPKTPNAYKLLLPRNPRVSAVLLHRSPIIRHKAGESLQLTSVPRLAKLFPHAADGKERTLRLKRKIQRERRVIQDHFKHLRSRTFVRGRQQKQQPGSTHKKWTPIAQRIPFFNLKRFDQVRITSGHEALMWLTPSEYVKSRKDAAEKRFAQDRKRIEAAGETVTSEREKVWAEEAIKAEDSARREVEERAANGLEARFPRLFTIRRVDKVRAEVYLEGLHYEELPEVPDKRQPNQTRRVEIPIPYHRLQLRIPNIAIRRFVKELRNAGVDISDDALPKDVFAVRMETRHVRAPDGRTKRFRWEDSNMISLRESSTSVAAQRRVEGRVQRAERVLAELEAAEKGIEVQRTTVQKRIVVRRLGAELFEPVLVETAKDGVRREAVESVEVDETIDTTTNTVLGSIPVPKRTYYQPKRFSWDRVVLETFPPLNAPSVVRRVRVGETADEVRYEEVEQKPKITLLATPEPKDMLSEERYAPTARDTPAEVVAAVSWSPPTVAVLQDAVGGASSSSSGDFLALPDRYLESRNAQANDFFDASIDMGEALPVERLLHKELANPYGKDKLARARLARAQKAADEQADFVADHVGAHLVREARVQEGIEPRVGRKQSVDEVILTARRRWAELVTARRADEKAAFEKRHREKWGPSKTEKKAVRKARKKALLTDQLRKTTLLPGKNQVIPVGLQRFQTDAPR